ncbi:MAG: GAF domain-containing protein [Chloroflexi bacterium]|nr:GAF domain-containing protein [Chloroflexota bacterium]
MSDNQSADNATPEINVTVALDNAMNETVHLERVLDRLVDLLKDNGFQVSVDLVTMARNLHQHLSEAQQQTRGMSAHLDQLEELLDTFALITSTLELEQVLDQVMDTVIKFAGAERAYLMLREKLTGELDIAVARNWDRESLSDDDAIFSRSIVTTTLREGRPIITTNAQSDDRFQNVLSVVNNQLRSILCIPLIVQGEAVGVLYADNRMNQAIFRQESVPLLTAFGTQAAIAIENARRFSQVRNDLDEALNRIQKLEIQIDKGKVSQQVSEITETDFFERLTSEARSMRQRADKA